MDLLTLRQRSFVLWRPARTQPAPTLVIGQLQPGAPVTLTGEQRIPLKQWDQFPELWLVAAEDCGLTSDRVYHYWFEVTDAHPARSGQRIMITDPLASMVDWRLMGPRPPGGEYTGDDRYPAAVICYIDGALVSCDAGNETGEPVDTAPTELPPNNRIVIYELPTVWAKTTDDGMYQRGVGTFRDIQALVDQGTTGANFVGMDVTALGHSYLADELGINAVELLPPADSFYVRTWGYGTTNFLAPDYELGFPADSSHPTPNRDLSALVTALHEHGIRFFVDSVAAFAKLSPYLAAATDDFFIIDPGRAARSDPDRYNSRGGIRDGFGSTLFRYETFHNGYDPVTGTQQRLSPASALMRTALVRWMNDFHVDGIRMDSIENVFSWNFVGAYRDLARELWLERCGAQPGDTQCEARFLVVGEELSEPLALLGQQRLDGLWHESFKRYVRAVVLGQSVDGFSFEETVRRMVDCRAFGYSDLAQAVIYLTSHDVEGFRNERLFNYLQSNGVIDCEKRVKLAFGCLLTAVGIPQILAGDEFADQHDLFDSSGNVTQDGNKQLDPVNYVRLGQDWRRRIKECVARLIRLRTTCDALAVNDTDFIHVDFNEGKRVLVWRRGGPTSTNPVVVVANFSDWGTPDPTAATAEYVVPNWPLTPPGLGWHEVTQDRDVPPEWAGREPLYAWEAKVYVLR